MHARQKIIAAAVTALAAAVPAVEGRVYEDDGSNLAEKKLPALLVRDGDEVVEEGAGVKERRLRLEVYAAAAGATDLRARLNTIGAQVETVLDQALDVGGVAVSMTHRGITADSNATLERTVAHLVFLYDAVYVTAHGQPEELIP